MAKLGNIDEKKIAGASYIFAFYKEVQILTDYYAQYINFLLEVKEKTKGENLEKLDEAVKTTIMQGVQQARISAHKTYIQYISIVDVLKRGKQDKIGEIYKRIKTDYIIKEEDLRDYVVALNKVLLNEVIQSLLEDSQTIINQVYTEGKDAEGAE